MIALCSYSDEADCTPIQRAATLAFWYMSEVYNGGHVQYFVNYRKPDYRHVLQALTDIGAAEQTGILDSALKALPRDGVPFPDTAEEFVALYGQVNLGQYDTAFYRCARTIEDCLADYLTLYESEFIEWT